MAGLHREVYVEARTPVHVADVRCAADLDVATGTGHLTVDTVAGFSVAPSKGWSTRVTPTHKLTLPLLSVHSTAVSLLVASVELEAAVPV